MGFSRVHAFIQIVLNKNSRILMTPNPRKPPFHENLFTITNLKSRIFVQYNLNKSVNSAKNHALQCSAFRNFSVGIPQPLSELLNNFLIDFTLFEMRYAFSPAKLNNSFRKKFLESLNRFH